MGSTCVHPPTSANGARVELVSSRDHRGNTVSGCRVINRFKTLELPQQALARLIAGASEQPEALSASLIE